MIDGVDDKQGEDKDPAALVVRRSAISYHEQSVAGLSGIRLRLVCDKARQSCLASLSLCFAEVVESKARQSTGEPTWRAEIHMPKSDRFNYDGRTRTMCASAIGCTRFAHVPCCRRLRQRLLCMLSRGALKAAFRALISCWSERVRIRHESAGRRGGLAAPSVRHNESVLQRRQHLIRVLVTSRRLSRSRCAGPFTG
jgi:hypothetical protein